MKAFITANGFTVLAECDSERELLGRWMNSHQDNPISATHSMFIEKVEFRVRTQSEDSPKQEDTGLWEIRYGDPQNKRCMTVDPLAVVAVKPDVDADATKVCVAEEWWRIDRPYEEVVAEWKAKRVEALALRK